MAGAYRWKGTVHFGALQFNVTARSAVKTVAFSFNQHHADCGGRLHQGGMVCEGCGEMGVDKESIVKGYGGKAGVDMEYLESLEAEATQSCRLDKLVAESEIDARYFQKSYNVGPDKGSERQYVLFMDVLDDLQLVAVGTVVMGGKEYIAVFRPRAGILSMEILYWPEELLPFTEAEDAIEGIEITEKELALGKKLALAMAAPFAPAGYVNTYAEQLAAYLDAFMADATPAIITKTAHKSPGATSLEDALAASLAMLGEPEETPKPKKARSKKAAA